MTLPITLPNIVHCKFLRRVLTKHRSTQACIYLSFCKKIHKVCTINVLRNRPFRAIVAIQFWAVSIIRLFDIAAIPEE